VKILLKPNDFSLNTQHSQGGILLLYAASKGHKGVVKILGERDQVTPDTADTCSLAPLSNAAEDRHEGVGKIVLEQDDVNPHRSSRCSQTLLLCTTRNGGERVGFPVSLIGLFAAWPYCLLASSLFRCFPLSKVPVSLFLYFTISSFFV